MNFRKRLFAVLLCAVIGTSFEGRMNPSFAQAKGDYPVSSPYVGGDDIAAWDLVSFGNYFQSGAAAKEPVMWRVLSVENDTALLLSDKILDCKPFHSEIQDNLTWETSSIRGWFNNDFYNAAFSDDEKKAIQAVSIVNEDNPFYNTKGGVNTTDNVYLLSISEVSNRAYGFSQNRESSSQTRAAKGSNYAASEEWWLRTPGRTSYPDMRTVYASFVDYTGRMNPSGTMITGSIGVRPVIRIKLSSDEWSCAGAVKSDGSYVDAPKKPVMKKAKLKTGKKAVLTLGKKKNGVSGYKIVYSYTKNFKSAKTTYTTGTQVTLKKLKTGKKYYIKACAFKKIGNKKIYGDFGKTVKINVK